MFDLGPGALEWRDSEDNLLATGATLVISNLPEGENTIRLYAYDSDGQSAWIPTMVEMLP